MGPSGSGKTFSALRLATGMSRVIKGDIHVIDTEARRALHYADRFKFQHTPFGAPFSPDDYLAAIDHCIKLGAKTIIVDSMSHEHEGEGGVLEMHEAECQRLMKEWRSSRGVVQMSAWAYPKSRRTRLINTILQYECNFIFCFRAKEKIKVLSKKEKNEAETKDAIKELGWQPIAGQEFVYEMVTCAFLNPGGRGVPVWNPELPDEKKFVKLPEQFIEPLTHNESFCEAHGEIMARWSIGHDVKQACQDIRDRIARRNGNGHKQQPSPVEPPPSEREFNDADEFDRAGA